MIAMTLKILEINTEKTYTDIGGVFNKWAIEKAHATKTTMYD